MAIDTTSLVSVWEMDEASGDALDSFGSNTLTDTNTVASATGKINNCRDFEDTNTEYFTHTDNASLSTGDIDFTFTAWVQLESKGANRRIVNKINSAVTVLEYQLFFRNDLDRFRFEVFDGTNLKGAQSATTLGSPSLATWYFIVAWHDATANTVSIQVNDGTVDSSATSGAPADTSAPFTIGSLDGLASDGGAPSHWDGLIDQVTFWKRVLTSGERTALYNSGSGLAYADWNPSGQPYIKRLGGVLHAGRQIVSGIRQW